MTWGCAKSTNGQISKNTPKLNPGRYCQHQISFMAKTTHHILLPLQPDIWLLHLWLLNLDFYLLCQSKWDIIFFSIFYPQSSIHLSNMIDLTKYKSSISNQLWFYRKFRLLKVVYTHVIFTYILSLLIPLGLAIMVVNKSRIGSFSENWVILEGDVLCNASRWA